MPLTLGLLGGPGPASALDFLAKLQAATPARQDVQHIRVIADINPLLPSGSGAGAALAEMGGALGGAGADVLAIASNGAHVHSDVIQRASGLPLIDMIATAAAAAGRTGARRVGVLGARSAVRLYHEHIAAGAMGMITLEAERQAAFIEAVAAIKDGDRSEAMGDRLATFAADLVEAGSQVVILAGMDTAMLLRREAVKTRFIDPADELARRCAAVCLGAEPLPQRPAGSWSSVI